MALEDREFFLAGAAALNMEPRPPVAR